MNHASLFSGIGGFDLAADWMGWQNILQVENDQFCQQVLQHYWPDAYLHGDIKQTDFRNYAGHIDILTGGFPCQPYSNAGKREGTNDERDQWPQMLRAVQEIKPRFVVGENVPGLLSWDGGLVFEQVCANLEAEGYQVQPLLLPAAGLNAPHKRERAWFVAYAKGKRMERNRPDREQKSQTQITAELSGCDNTGKGWADFPAQSPIHAGNDGIPAQLDGITLSNLRKESIKAAGNAIVPQVAFKLFQSIEYSQHLNNTDAHRPPQTSEQKQTG